MVHNETYEKLQTIKSAPLFVDMVIAYAEMHAISDIHIDCDRNGSCIRFRKFGIIEPELRNIVCSHAELIACFKVLAGIRTDEHMLSHDGRIHYKLKNGTSVDLRLSIMPTYHGENCVIRLLRPQQTEITFESLGFTKNQIRIVHQALSYPQGCICVVGPTGSGKTTTLYAALQYIISQSKMLVTIEDPVEYEMKGVRQVQVSSKTGSHVHGLSFAQGLKALLRQDPDVIMVGEIRDKETAVIAMNAALTGHLVLTSLHAKDCAGAFVRLADIGIDMTLAASSLTLVIAQRLVRTRDSEHRKGVYEFLYVSPEVQESLRKGLRTSILNRLREKQGSRSLREMAYELITENTTTQQEVDRIFGTDTL